MDTQNKIDDLQKMSWSQIGQSYGKYMGGLPTYRSKKPFIEYFDGISIHQILEGKSKSELHVRVVKIGDYRLQNKISLEQVDNMIGVIKSQLLEALKVETKPSDRDIERGRRIFEKYKNDEDFIFSFFVCIFTMSEKRWFANRFIEKGTFKVEDLIEVTQFII